MITVRRDAVKNRPQPALPPCAQRRISLGLAVRHQLRAGQPLSRRGVYGHEQRQASGRPPHTICPMARHGECW